MFKVGDRVKCIYVYRWDKKIILNNTYTIAKIINTKENIICIHTKETYEQYFFDQFVLDIKETRKVKLEKICLK